MRVSELAKQLKIPSKELLAKLKELRITVKSHASTLDADAVNRTRKALAAAAKAAAAKKAALKAKAAVSAKPVAVKPGAAKVAAVKKPTAARRPAPSAKPEAETTVKEAPAKPAAAAKAAVVPTPKRAAPSKVKAKPVAPPAKEAEREVVPAGPPKQLELQFPITIKDLSAKMDVKAGDLIKYLMTQGIFASIIQSLDEATAKKAAGVFNCEILSAPTLEDQLLKTFKPDPSKLKLRAPVVTFMGHVDHGKTSLLDAIRESSVAAKETGGITQHIGAYEVELGRGRVTFLDTPGHEAFTALRARGANVTDVVVLVVAADDGVMPQTIEAIDHAKAANVPIVVAINKSDLPEANPQKVKQQLTQYDLVAEDWGGKTIMMGVSAKTRAGIEQLLEMLLLEAELLELKGDPSMPAMGVVIEAKKTKDRGSVATLLIQQGTLRLGDAILVGSVVGRVRAMVSGRGVRMKEADPATPVEILGLPEVPQAGDSFHVVSDEKTAKQIAEQRREKRAQEAAMHRRRITLEDLHQQIKEGKLKELKLILKADVQGSLEAILQSLHKLDMEKVEVAFRILHTGVGDINESDVILAAASDAVVVGFHVGIDPRVQVLAANEGVDVHLFRIIYELVNSIKAAIEGLLEPAIEETFLGRAEVRKLFQISKIGMVAGCMVTKGTIRRDATFRVIRGKDRVYEGKIDNLKRVKDDAREVQEGVECGISLVGDCDLQVGDLIEAWELKKVARKLA